jgi:hypothetical protein
MVETCERCQPTIIGFAKASRAPGPRLMRTGSGPIADPDQREGEDGEADEEDDDDYEAPDGVGFESGFGSR